MDLLQDPTLLFIFCISCFILYLSLKSLRSRGNLPPGPTPLPLLGNALDVRGDIVNSLMKLREKYGDVFTIYLGSRPVMVVTGYKLVKEIYVDKGDDFLNRGSMPSWDQFYKNYGVVFTKNIERWKELRRFSLSALWDFGLGKRTAEDHIQEETCYLLAELSKTKESFFDPRQCLSRAFCNVIFTIMFGNRCEYEDTDIATVLACIYEAFMTSSTPWGQEKINPNSEFNMKNLLASTLQIFFAGVETISTTITYSLLIFLKYPDVRAKVHKEIDQVIGRIRSPSIQDRPYTEAVMHELQRFTDLLPMGVPSKTMKEVKLKGYTLPKDTDVFPVLTSVLKDPTCFKHPTEFSPENFLNEKEEFQKNVGFMPLGAGRRICLGESLERVELFLFLITILQNFDLTSPIPLEDLDINPNTSGLGNIPKPYKIAFIPR